MDIEFVDAQPGPADEPEDVLAAGRPRRVPRWIGTAALALLVASGGVTWLATRPADAPAHPVAATSSRPPAPAHISEDVLAGCPNTLACDATHQMQQHQIDMIRTAMLQRGKPHPWVSSGGWARTTVLPRGTTHRVPSVGWTAGFTSGGTRVR